jgi:hypothetical protein
VAKPKEPFNPFYALLVLLGVIFFVTASAYGVMAFKAVQAPVAEDVATPHPLLVFLDQHGMQLLVVELVLLALATFGAMGTDRYWINRAERRANDARQANSAED